MNWRAESEMFHGEPRGSWFVLSDDDVVVVVPAGPHAEKHARLIAASPALLAALRDSTDQLAAWGRVPDMVKAHRALLARAREGGAK